MVEIYWGPDKDRCGDTRFGPVSNPPQFVAGEPVDPVPPLMLFDVPCVAAALDPESPHDCPCGRDGVVTTASPDGFIRIAGRSRVWVYELFPACWSDGLEQAMYVGVWRD